MRVRVRDMSEQEGEPGTEPAWLRLHGHSRGWLRIDTALLSPPRTAFNKHTASQELRHPHSGVELSSGARPLWGTKGSLRTTPDSLLCPKTVARRLVAYRWQGRWHSMSRPTWEFLYWMERERARLGSAQGSISPSEDQGSSAEMVMEPGDCM